MFDQDASLPAAEPHAETRSTGVGRPPPTRLRGFGPTGEASPGAAARVFDGLYDPPSGGQRLPASIERTAGARLGADLSDVRIHTGAQAGDETRVAGARAMTQGNAIRFKAGEYAPDTVEGRRLLAHELVHVVQQARHGQSAVQHKSLASQPDEASEHEADAAADALVDGSGPVAVTQAAAPGRLHRKPDPAAPPPKVSASHGKAVVEVMKARQAAQSLETVAALVPAGAGPHKKAASLEAALSSLGARQAAAYGAVLTPCMVGVVLLLNAETEERLAGREPDPELARKRVELQEIQTKAIATMKSITAKLATAQAALDEMKAAEATAKAKAAKDPADKDPKKHDHELGTTDDGDVKGKTKISGGAGEGKLVGGGEHEKDEVDRDAGTHTRTTTGVEAKIGADGGGVQISSGGKKETGYDVDTERKEIDAHHEEQRDRAERGVLPGEPDLNKPPAPKKDVPKYDSREHKSTGGVGVDEKGVSVNSGHEVTDTKADGSSTSKGSNVKLGVDKDGNPSTEVSAKYGTKSKDGKELNVDGSLAVDKDGVTAKGSVGNEKLTVGGEYVDKEGETTVKGNVKIGDKEKSVTVGGGTTIKFQPPVELPSGKFAVTYSVAEEANAGGSAGKGGKSVGGSLEGSRTLIVTKVFDSAAEAEAFRAKESAGDVALPTTASAAAGLQPGERIAEGSSEGIGVKGSVGNDSAKIGANVGAKKGEETAVEMGHGGFVTVERTFSNELSAGGSVGNVVSVGGKETFKNLKMIKIRVPLGTEEKPDERGRAAYDAFLASGAVNPPAETIATTDMSGRTSGREISVGPLTIMNTSEVRDTTTYTEEGKTEESLGKRTRGYKLDLPIIGGEGEYSSSMRAIEVNDEERGYLLSSEVKLEGAHDTSHELARATGTKERSETDIGEDTRSSGKWRVESAMSPDAADRFVAKVKSGEFDPRFGTTKAGTTVTGPGERLQEAIAEAGDDPDLQRKALAKFVAEGGEDAIRQLRRYGGGKEEYFLTLTDDKGEPDPMFRGVEGRIEMEAKIADCEAQAASATEDPGLALMRVKSVMSEARARVAIITPERYPDLPPELLQAEKARSQGDLARLDRLLVGLKKATAEKRVKEQALSPEERAELLAERRLTEPGQVERKEIDEKLAGKVDDPGPEQAAEEASMRVEKERAAAHMKAARAGRERHSRVNQNAHRGIRRELEEDYGDSYASADESFADGVKLWQAACIMENLALTMPESTPEQVRASLGVFNQAAHMFISAGGRFSNTATALKYVQKSNNDGRLF
jgi:hypothetical protein